jgi:hypothetical protein
MFGLGIIMPLKQFLASGSVPTTMNITLNGQPLNQDTDPELVRSSITMVTTMLIIIWCFVILYTLHIRSQKYQIDDTKIETAWTFPYVGQKHVPLKQIREVNSSSFLGLQTLTIRSGKSNFLNSFFRLNVTKFSNLNNAAEAERFLISKLRESPHNE